MKSILLTTAYYFFELLNLLIFIRVLLSWIKHDQYNKYINILYQLTDPILEPFRALSQKMGFNNGAIDFSPIVALLFLQFVIQPLVTYGIYYLVK